VVAGLLEEDLEGRLAKLVEDERGCRDRLDAGAGDKEDVVRDGDVPVADGECCAVVALGMSTQNK
jgi:hypothetical protein